MSGDLTQFLVGYSRTGHELDVPLAVKAMLPQFSVHDIKELVTGILRGQAVEEILKTYLRIRKDPPQALSDASLARG
jgi:hypothetical protein